MDTRDITRRTSHSERRSAWTSTVAALGMVGIVTMLAGCSVVEPYLPTQQHHYDTYGDAPTRETSDDAAWRMPDWVPQDAEDIDVRLNTSGRGYAIGFTSKRGVDSESCRSVDGRFGGPAMTADFLPEDLPATGLLTCGDDYLVAEVHGRWFGWAPEEHVPDPTPEG